MKTFQKLLVAILFAALPALATDTAMEHVNGASSGTFVPPTQSDIANAVSAAGAGGSTGQVGNGITSTCQPANTSGLIYAIPSCTFVLAGVQYTSTAGTVTLTAADATDPRIDTLIFDTAIGGYASKATGTAAANPSEPTLDPATQIKITNVSIAANATTPTGLSNENAYLENTEWTGTAGTGWALADTGNPHSGTKSLKATAVAAAAFTKLVRSATISPNTYQQLNMWVAPVTWNSGRSLNVTLRDANGTTVGNAVTIQNGSYGFSRTSTAYQLIAIPISQFGVPAGAVAKELRFNPVGTGGTFTFYIDDVVFQTATNAAVFPNPQYDSRYLPPGVTGAVPKKGADGLLADSGFVARGNMLGVQTGATTIGAPFTGGFAFVASSTTTSTNSAGTTHTLPLPSDVTANDLLIMIVSAGSQATFTVPGWTSFGRSVITVNEQEVFYKVATGLETAGTFSSGSSTTLATAVISIRGADTAVAPQIASTTHDVGDTTTYDPPSLTPTWGALNTFWIAEASFRDGAQTFNSDPTNYTHLLFQASVSQGGGVMASWRKLNATSENPGTMSTNGSGNRNIASTIAVKPSTGAVVENGFRVKSNGVTSAVNFANTTNAATGAAPSIGVEGDDTNIDLNLVTKGTGVAKVNGTPIPTTSSSLTDVPRWRAAAACDNATPAPLWDLFTSLQPTPTCYTGTNTQKAYLDFPDVDGAYQAQLTEMLPSYFTGTFNIKIKWLSAATSGNVVWQVATACVADAATDDPSFNTASTVTDAAKGTTLQTNDASISGVTSTGCVAGYLMHVKIMRDRTHASDTIAGVISFIGAELNFQ